MIIAIEDNNFPIGILSTVTHQLVDTFTSVENAMEELNLEIFQLEKINGAT